MEKQFVYFYFMKNEPDKIQQIAPSHVSYWKNSHVEGYSGGPFTDRSGGLVTFKANRIEEAEKLVYGDPFILKDLLENKWIKEWMVE